jgi:hypothetical protein
MHRGRFGRGSHRRAGGFQFRGQYPKGLLQMRPTGLFCLRDNLKPLRCRAGEQASPDLTEKRWRQKPIGESIGLGAGYRAQIGTRPDKTIDLAHHRPGAIATTRLETAERGTPRSGACAGRNRGGRMEWPPWLASSKPRAESIPSVPTLRLGCRITAEPAASERNGGGHQRFPTSRRQGDGE